MARTYAQAKTEVFEHLRRRGWDVNATLKVPHATSPSRTVRLWFKPQAVWYSETDGRASHNISFARSTWIDIRSMTPEQFENEVARITAPARS